MRVAGVLVVLAVLMFAAVVPVDTALAQTANPSRVLPDKVQRGETFNVTVTFTSPADMLHSIYLRDFAPTGWTVIVDKTWCVPNTDDANATGNKAELGWWAGLYANGTAFTAVYKVTVPHDAELGIHAFTGILRYWIGSKGPYLENITGGYEVEAILPVISFSPTDFSFTAMEGEPNPPSQTLTIWTLREETVNWTIHDDADWLEETPASGSLASGEYDYVGVSVATAGLASGMYSANISLQAVNATWRIPVSLEIRGAIVINVTRYINGTMKLPNVLYSGDIFTVIVNWTAPLNNFSAIGLTDLAPPGFEVEANATWCDPDADELNAIGSKVEIAWFGPYDNGTNFMAMYKVTVPSTAAPGSHFFPYNNCSLGWLEYYFGEEWVFTSCTMGDYEVVVTVPGDIVGETRSVNANELSDVTVTLYKDSSGIASDISTPNYSIGVNETGEYWLLATKDGFYEINMTNMLVLPDLYINLTTPELLAAGYTFDFEGNYGLIPTNCAMSYALKSVNLWLSPPADHPEWGIDEWKAMDVCTAWLYPS
jgi:hypothetical protein